REAFEEYLAPVIADRKACPGEDILSHVLDADLTGFTLERHDLVVKTVLAMFGAGSHTTQTALANAILELHRHPDELARLRAEPALLRSAIEEVLRFRSPAQAIRRITRTE